MLTQTVAESYNVVGGNFADEHAVGQEKSAESLRRLRTLCVVDDNGYTNCVDNGGTFESFALQTAHG